MGIPILPLVEFCSWFKIIGLGSCTDLISMIGIESSKLNQTLREVFSSISKGFELYRCFNWIHIRFWSNLDHVAIYLRSIQPIYSWILYMSGKFYFTESKWWVSRACVPIFTILGNLFTFFVIYLLTRAQQVIFVRKFSIYIFKRWTLAVPYLFVGKSKWHEIYIDFICFSILHPVARSILQFSPYSGLYWPVYQNSAIRVLLVCFIALIAIIISRCTLNLILSTFCKEDL